jgi:hypothetical protein
MKYSKWMCGECYFIHEEKKYGLTQNSNQYLFLSMLIKPSVTICDNKKISFV